MAITGYTPQAHILDRLAHKALGRLGRGLSPASLTLAFFDWLLHLAIYPGKQSELIDKANENFFRLSCFIAKGLPADQPCVQPDPQDKRFVDPAWQQPPFNLIYQNFLLQQGWWREATCRLRGLTRHHEDVVRFMARQWLDMVSPSNFLVSNPEVLAATIAQGGANLERGAANLVSDTLEAFTQDQPMRTPGFEVGKNLAITPGKVILRNRLIELIQYAPATETTYPEPVLIVPSWIMKYYILDLSPENSLVRYLVEHGHTVFIISWLNPGAGDRELSMDDYLKLGPLAAIHAVSEMLPDNPRINAVGYCLGGTLLSIAAAKLARDNAPKLRSMTLLAAETDFEEPGELSLFIDESQIAYIEDLMWDPGYLDGKKMGDSFALLNSRDLVWSRMVHDYLMGTRRPITDLMAWNSDTTRMPYRMHSEYLRSFYLNNELSHGTYLVDGRPVVMSDIRAPIFSVGTIKDHVSPWHSVFKIHLITDTEVTFVLTSGGHNAGIVSEPGHPRRSYQIGIKRRGDRFIDAETWKSSKPVKPGSWWPAWQEWLAAHSGSQVPAPAWGGGKEAFQPIDDAPGSYVMVS